MIQFILSTTRMRTQGQSFQKDFMYIMLLISDGQLCSLWTSEQLRETCLIQTFFAGVGETKHLKSFLFFKIFAAPFQLIILNI